MAATEDQPSEDTRRVCTVLRNVKVQVVGFTVEVGGDAIVIDGDNDVKEVNLTSIGLNNPPEAMIVIDVLLELLPLFIVDSCIVVLDPDTKNIINISSIVDDIWMLGEHPLFFDSKEKISI